MSTIPNNALQRDRRRAIQRAKRPNVHTNNEIDVEVLEVYDAQKIEQDGIPNKVNKLIVREPGTLYAKVRILRTGREIYVGFLMPESYIFSTYGNGVLIEGLRGKIWYRGLRPEGGRLVLTGKPRAALRNFQTTNTYSISGIF